MSETVIRARVVVCDWPGCKRAVPGGSFEWLHTEDRQDYCRKHWHWEGNDPSPGPESESELSCGNIPEEVAQILEAVGWGFPPSGHGRKEGA